MKTTNYFIGINQLDDWLKEVKLSPENYRCINVHILCNNTGELIESIKIEDLINII